MKYSHFDAFELCFCLAMAVLYAFSHGWINWLGYIERVGWFKIHSY